MSCLTLIHASAHGVFIRGITVHGSLSSFALDITLFVAKAATTSIPDAEHDVT